MPAQFKNRFKISIKVLAIGLGTGFGSVLVNPALAEDLFEPSTDLRYDTAPPDHRLVQALSQATRSENGLSTDLDALVWLSTMSERLESRIKNPFYRIRLLEAIYSEAQLNGLDPQMILAVMDIESNFDRYAESHAGAQGLMQVMPFWKDVHGRPNDDLFNPLTSIKYGCSILRHYLDRHDNPEHALAAYNGSLGRSTYSDKIMRRWNSRWTYQADEYSRSTEPKFAVGEAGSANTAVLD